MGPFRHQRRWQPRGGYCRKGTARRVHDFAGDQRDSCDQSVDLYQDAVRRDQGFRAGHAVASAPNLLVVTPSLPVTSTAELIALAKARPGQLTFGSAGNGTTLHLSGELFKTMAGIDMVHVPYKGGAPALGALISGEVQVSFTSGVIIPHYKAGRLKTLAVTGAKRTSLAPEIPTIAEAGVPGYEVTGWYGLVAPAKTPAAIVERLNVTMNRVLPELRERYANLGMDLGGGTAAEFGAYLKSERDKWARVVKISGAKAD